ncbi:heparin lyase I family protein [Blastococcus sp. SYSU D00695]
MIIAAINLLSGTGVAVAGESYRLRCADDPYSYRQTTAPNGATVRRHELRAGDIAALDAKYSDGRQRCEQIGQTDYPFDTNIWFSYSFRQTGQMPKSWVTMSQFHAAPESGERSGKPPAFLMQQSNGRLQLLTRSDTRVNTTTQVAPVVRFSMPWFPANTWEDVVVRLVFDPFGNGRVTFWLNGTQKYDSGRIPMGYNDTVGPHFAQGQYRGASSLTTTFEFANIEVGRTSLLDRVSNPKPLPN